MSEQQRTVAIQSQNGSFLSADGGGGGGLWANRPAQGPWEKFTLGAADPTALQIHSGDKVWLMTNNNHFVTAEGGGGQQTNANRSQVGPWETFTISLLGPTEPSGLLFPISGVIPHGTHDNPVHVAFRASDGSWLTAEGGGGGAVNANRPAIGDWERFTMWEDVH
jgi:hypothetical protein